MDIIKQLIRAQYGIQNKIKVCEFLMLSITAHFQTREYQFIRRVRNMYANL